MNKFYLLLLCTTGVLLAGGQPGSLDFSFGNNGIQTTSFLSDVNLLNEEGSKVVTSTTGDIFVVVHTAYNIVTRIAKYLPDGKLDSSYGDGGYPNTAHFININSVAIQGYKIIVAGSASDPVNSTTNFALARYTANGMLDSTFGVNGKVTTDFYHLNDYANSIALQGNKILVVGTTYRSTSSTYDFALARYMADGRLDTSFGEKGMVTTDFGNSNDIANSITLQGEKIIVGGNIGNYPQSDFALARYVANGTLDSTFGVNGRIIIDFGGYDYENSVALQVAKIIVAGNSSGSFVLIRYTSDGMPDSSFGVNGKLTPDFGASSMALQGDKILVAGTIANLDTYDDFALARYDADGVLDSSFGGNGKETTDFGDYDYANSITLQGDKIIVAGYAYGYFVNYNEDLALARYTADGTMDASFGKNGLLTGYLPSSQTFFTSTAILGDKIIAAGYAYQDSDSYDFVLACYTTDGVLDSSFGVNGKVTTDFNDSYDRANAIAIQGNKIIVAGYTGNSTNYNFALVRYIADGKLDSSFGVNGKVTTDFNFDDQANSIAIQGNKIVVAGSSNNDFALARYTTEGRLDLSFGVNGVVTTDFDGSVDYVRSIIIQEGNVIVGGFSNYSNVVLARYTANGMLDFSFGENGKVKTDLNKSHDYFESSIGLQRNKILVSGEYNFSGFALTRYTADGRLDSSFGEHGIATTSFNNDYDVATSIALQEDKIILGGYSNNISEFGTNDFALARYTANGTLDSTFGVNGKVTTLLGDANLGASGSLQAIALYQNRLYAVGNLSFYKDVTGETYGTVAAYQLEAPEPAISIAEVTVAESKKFAIVTIRLSASTNKLVRVHFITRNKTAVRNEDYIGINGPLLFIPGVNTTAKVFIPLIDDNNNEENEQFEIVLSNARNATIQDSIGVVTIVDNDNAPITKQNTSFHIDASPNPYAESTTVQLHSSNLKEPAFVQVYDVSGRLLETRMDISIGRSLRLGDQYKTGIYIIEAVQGSQKVQTKVVKAGK